MKSRALTLFFILLSLVNHAFAQDSDSLSLRLSRDFGSGFGTQIQGTFSFRVDGPDDLERVIFFIDDVEVGQDSQAPFALQFHTENYDPGAHTLRAEGYSTNGRQIDSNTLRREFITGANAARLALYIIIPILALSLGGRAITSWIANRNQQKSSLPSISGALGGTICPNCTRPYAFHVWSFNFVTRRIDRCPHCGQWKVVKRYPQAVLEASAEAMVAAQTKATAVSSHPSLSPDEQIRKNLEDSRFEDNESNPLS